MYIHSHSLLLLIYSHVFNNQIYIQEIDLHVFTFTGVFLIHDYIYSHLQDVLIHIYRVIFTHIHDQNIHSNPHFLCTTFVHH